MAGERVERRLAAVVAADVAGYSRLMHDDEEATHAKLAALLADGVVPAITEHGGRIVKNTGDGFLAEFPSAVEAVRAALQFQTCVNELTIGEIEDKRIAFRVGVNIGDVIVEAHDIFGDGVNIAARLESIAEPGGVCISSFAYDQVRGKVEVEFVDLGEQTLKNIDRPVRIYASKLKGGAISAPAPEAEKPLPLPDKPSIAVLPFDNMSDDPEQEYFTDGMVEDIITALSRFKSLFVIARNSSFTYKGKAVEIKQVGRELGVRYVLEGSVRKTGDKVRISGQLIEAATGANLWLTGLTELWMTSLRCRTRSHQTSSRQSSRALYRRRSIARSANRLKASTPLTCTTVLSTLTGALPVKDTKMLCGLPGKRFRSIPILRPRMA